jgi:2-amino-4-hydroxy-6-hydroxymethyldihydropteridine diphosphokinase
VGEGGGGAQVDPGGPAGELVLLGLGANVGDPARQIRDAVEALAEVLEGMVVSSLYRSTAVGYVDQPDYLNVVCLGRTGLAPSGLLAESQRIEQRMGRVRSHRNAPRPIDIDILAFGDRAIRSAELTVPHPRMHERGFVLAPLIEIAPDWRHPVLGATPAEMLRDAAYPQAERVDGLFA